MTPNHYHLVLRPRETRLQDLMRRLMTGYAGWYNRRHRRRGHLFQNRYRSIVVEEEPHLLELVRYVGLNPVRAGLVNGLNALDGFPYTGHAVLLGRRPYPAYDVDAVLGRFGAEVGAARQRYRAFVADGLGGSAGGVSRRRIGAERPAAVRTVQEVLDEVGRTHGVAAGEILGPSRERRSTIGRRRRPVRLLPTWPV